QDAANHLAQRRSKEDGEESARSGEYELEKPAPDRIIHVRAEFDADAAQHQKPQHNHKGQVETAEAGGVEQRKGEVEGTSGSEQPDFIAIPHRADGAHDGLAFGGRTGGSEIDDART